MGTPALPSRPREGQQEKIQCAFFVSKQIKRKTAGIAVFIGPYDVLVTALMVVNY